MTQSDAQQAVSSAVAPEAAAAGLADAGQAGQTRRGFPNAAALHHELTNLAAIFRLPILKSEPAQIAAGRELGLRSPLAGALAYAVPRHDEAALSAKIASASAAFAIWREIPPPARGAVVKTLGESLRRFCDPLSRLITLETGKIPAEAHGEVQEAIDICDFATGLSRQLYGLTIASERPAHRLMETWHPLGVCGVITAFNFPLAVFAWNAALALVCGNSLIWKPSEKTPLTALAAQALLQDALQTAGYGNMTALCQVAIGEAELGQALCRDHRVALVSATGSTAMGQKVAPVLAGRFARAILELGGNNGAIVAPSADLDQAVRAIGFAAFGTAGQRCTSLRRLFVHDDVYETLLQRLKQAYASVPVGDVYDPATLVGPLIDEDAYLRMQAALAEARLLGAAVLGGERCHLEAGESAFYVRPALVEMLTQSGPMLQETFAPILYVMRYHDLGEAIALHNAVSAGLASSIFTRDLREAERFLSAAGSDCGIANVNIGPSGAEIGGAFGGEKESGGGREAGSDSWKAYMRRATNTINFGTGLPLAQGIRFEL